MGLFSAQLAELSQANARADAALVRILDAARELRPSDRAGAVELLAVAEVVGRREQADHGQLLQLLAQVDRVKAARGGVAAWVAGHLDVTDGRARGIAQSARRIGAVPELAEPLSSGAVGSGTVSVLSRTAKAVRNTSRDTVTALTEVLETAQGVGVAAAKKQVRVLEETLEPGTGEQVVARQRARSFLRVTELEDGLCRFEVLLDAARATVLRSAIDAQAADWIRQAQFDHAQPLPEDVRSTEQINAQALVRLAEVFLAAPVQVREAAFTAPVLFFTSADTEDLWAESVYGGLVPRSHLLQLDEAGVPVRLDGRLVDAAPSARLASPAQRIALAYRDRHCTYPGCARPTTWSLHAHHRIPHSRGGATVLGNLALLCSEHHTLAHRRGE
ncbi:MAG TPA: HNH endonuclease [Actinospica sp.]|jgi:hypothetical protein|nr:HNH endonuclease [Actinospica sp.]